jgi:iron uptake system component EfeO
MKRSRFPKAAALLGSSLCAAALVAGGCGSSSDADEKPPASLESVEQAAIEKYRFWLEENAASLIDWTSQIRGQIAAGDLNKALSRYATSRVQFGQIEPASRIFESLNTRINAQAEDVPADEFTSFHRIEQALFAERTTDGLKPAADRLLKAVEKLKYKVTNAKLGALEIAEGTDATLEAIVSKELTGAEEPYSHLDLVDFAAGVEGSEAGFEAVRPLVAYEDQELTERIEAGFVKAYEAVNLHGLAAREQKVRPAAGGAVFIVFNALSPAEVRLLVEPMEALKKLFASVPALVETSEAESR